MYNCVYTAVKNLYGDTITEAQEKQLKELVKVTDIQEGISLQNLVVFANRASLHIEILNRDPLFNANVKEGIHTGNITATGKVNPKFMARLDALALKSYNTLRVPFVLMNFEHAIYVHAINRDGTFSYRDQDVDGKKHFFDALSQGYLIVMSKGTNTTQGGGGIVKKINYQN